VRGHPAARGNPHGGEHLKDLLVGQILWAGTTQILLARGLTAVLAGAMATGWSSAGADFGFYVPSRSR
jgi:zinc/manganese transport system permease protein